MATPGVGPKNRPVVTRRTLLGGGSVALASAITGFSVHTVPHGEDGELLALWPVWHDALAAFNTVLAAKGPIETRCFARKPVSPVPEDFDSDEEYAAATGRAFARFLEIQAEEGLTEIEQREGETLDTYHAIVDRIIAVPAQTIPGLLFKAEVSRGFEHNHEELLRSVIEDLMTLYREAPMCSQRSSESYARRR